MKRRNSLGHGCARLSGLRALAIVVAVFGLSPFGATALITIGALDTPGRGRDVEVVDGLAYVADGVSGLRIIDVTDPAARRRRH